MNKAPVTKEFKVNQRRFFIKYDKEGKKLLVANFKSPFQCSTVEPDDSKPLDSKLLALVNLPTHL